MDVRSYWRLTNPAIVLLLTFTAVTGGVIGGGLRNPLGLLEIAIAITLSSMGARSLTNYVDRDIDARMHRTRDRPLPSGAIMPSRALAFGLVLVGLGLVSALPLGLLYALLIAVGLVDNIVGYNLLSKRRTPWNIVLAAPSGGIPALVGYSSMVGHVDLTAFLLAALVVLWTPIHIWSLAIRYREDYARANVPMLPVALGVTSGIRCIAAATALLAVFTIALPLVPGSPLGYLTLVVVASLAVVLILLSGDLIRRPTIASAWRLFKFTSPYLAVVFVVMAADVAIVPRPW